MIARTSSTSYFTSSRKNSMFALVPGAPLSLSAASETDTPFSDSPFTEINKSPDFMPFL